MCFYSETASIEIYTLSLHDALPIYGSRGVDGGLRRRLDGGRAHEHRRRQHQHEDAQCSETQLSVHGELPLRSEEHTSELQSRQYLVCRLLLEKKKNDIHSAPV